jgi:NHS family xanthosine MFS transporter
MIEFVTGQRGYRADGLFSKVILMKDWHTIWIWLFACSSTVAFAVFSKHKHNIDVENVSH